MRLNTTLKLVAWIVVFQIIGFVLGLLTQANIYPWYANLTKSSLTPPDLVFVLVWPLLYALLAVVAWMLSNQKKGALNQSIYYLFVIQLLMNWAWSPLFFQLHWLKLSALWLLFLTVLNCILIIQVYNKQKAIALLLAPYVVWLLFASYLNGVVALMN